jgi:hypothetical protein
MSFSSSSKQKQAADTGDDQCSADRQKGMGKGKPFVITGHQVQQRMARGNGEQRKEGTPEGTYRGMITHNVDTIVQALK